MVWSPLEEPQTSLQTSCKCEAKEQHKVLKVSETGICPVSCWLRNDVAFYVAVVAYFGLVFILSLLVFIMVMVQLARIKRQNPQNQSPNRGVLTDLRSIVGLLVLLGLSWGFALLAWGPLRSPFVYLFTICNSLQGHCVLQIQSHTLLLHCGITQRFFTSGLCRFPGLCFPLRRQGERSQAVEEPPVLWEAAIG